MKTQKICSYVTFHYISKKLFTAVKDEKKIFLHQDFFFGVSEKNNYTRMLYPG
jgi:hypothetical protein